MKALLTVAALAVFFASAEAHDAMTTGAKKSDDAMHSGSMTSGSMTSGSMSSGAMKAHTTKKPKAAMKSDKGMKSGAMTSGAMTSGAMKSDTSMKSGATPH